MDWPLDHVIPYLWTESLMYQEVLTCLPCEDWLKLRLIKTYLKRLDSANRMHKKANSQLAAAVCMSL